jgi:hypothetical protein
MMLILNYGGGNRVLNVGSMTQKFGLTTNNQKEMIKIVNMRVDNENCLATTHPNLARALKNKEVAYEITAGSNRKEKFECDRCGYNEYKIVNNVKRQGYYVCPRCSDGVSYPEKFMFNVLEQSRVEFEKQKIFKWGSNKRYDFYIPSLNCLIETHGEQHYRGNYQSLGGRTLKEEKENDTYKHNLAIENGIKHYIIIDCRKSELEFIKANILESKLSILLNLSNINWLKCHEYGCNSLVKKCCRMWNEGIENTVEIGKILKLNRTTVSKYLKQGVKLGWCDYDPKEVMVKNGRLYVRKNNFSRLIGLTRARKVLQFSLNGEFIKEWDSIVQAMKSLSIKGNGNISLACSGKRNHAGGFQWIYKSDYEDGKKKPKIIPEKKSIVQLTLNNKYVSEFKDASEAARSIGKEVSSPIYKCCRRELKQSNGFKWVFKEDYKNDNYDKTIYTRIRAKPIIQLTMDNKFIKEWDGAYQIVEELGFSSGRISEARKGIRETAYGYKWVSKEDYDGNKERVPYTTNKKIRVIVRLDKDSNYIDEFDSIADASKTLKINRAHITSVCKGRYGFKTAGGFKWMYKEDYDKCIEEGY